LPATAINDRCGERCARERCYKAVAWVVTSPQLPHLQHLRYQVHRVSAADRLVWSRMFKWPLGGQFLRCAQRENISADRNASFPVQMASISRL